MPARRRAAPRSRSRRVVVAPYASTSRAQMHGSEAPGTLEEEEDGSPERGGAPASCVGRRPKGGTVFEIPTGWTVFHIPSASWAPTVRPVRYDVCGRDGSVAGGVFLVRCKQSAPPRTRRDDLARGEHLWRRVPAGRLRRGQNWEHGGVWPAASFCSRGRCTDAATHHRDGRLPVISTSPERAPSWATTLPRLSWHQLPAVQVEPMCRELSKSNLCAGREDAGGCNWQSVKA